MLVKLAVAILAFLAVTSFAEVTKTRQVVCYYDTKGVHRKADATYSAKYLIDAVGYCDYLIFGFIPINKKDYTLETVFDPAFEAQFRTYQDVLDLRESYPKLRILLSIGGGRDLHNPEKYLTLLESFHTRHDFISSAIDVAKKHKFDGLDIAWQFPTNKPKVVGQGFWSSAWSTIKSPFVSDKVDSKSHEHKQQFVDLLTELKKSCRNDGLLLSLSVLPNVNSTLYYNIPHLVENVDFINLWAFDFYTGERNPKEADLPAPLYEQVKRNPYDNAEHLVEYWCHNGAPSHKIFLGIPTFGRTWKVTNPAASCFPPLYDVDGPGLHGADTKEHGLLSFPEIHHKLSNSLTVLGASTTVKDGFSSHKYASYGLIPSDGCKHRDTWVGYEDPDTAAYKATYAHKKGLGGVAIVDVTLDDFRGLCLGVKYPILRAVSSFAKETKIPVTTIPTIINADINVNKPAVSNVDLNFNKPSTGGSELEANKPLVSNVDLVFGKPGGGDSDLNVNKPLTDNIDLTANQASSSNVDQSFNKPLTNNLDLTSNQASSSNADLGSNQASGSNLDFNAGQSSIVNVEQNTNQPSVSNLDLSVVQPSVSNVEQNTDQPAISNQDLNPAKPSISNLDLRVDNEPNPKPTKPRKPSYHKSNQS